MSDASGTLWLNVKERRWSKTLLNLTDLSEDHMPRLVEGNQKTAIVDKKLANELGFKNDVLIAGGAGDQAAGATGAGVIKSNQSVISLGTSGVYFSPTNEFISNTKDAVHSFCHSIPKTWHHMSVMLSATNCLDWISKICGLNISETMKKIENFSNYKFELNSTPYFLPYLSGERTPHNNAYLRGSFHLLNTSTDTDSLITLPSILNLINDSDIDNELLMILNIPLNLMIDSDTLNELLITLNIPLTLNLVSDTLTDSAIRLNIALRCICVSATCIVSTNVRVQDFLNASDILMVSFIILVIDLNLSLNV